MAEFNDFLNLVSEAKKEAEETVIETPAITAKIKKPKLNFSLKLEDVSFLSELETEMVKSKEVEKVEKLKEEEIFSFFESIDIPLNPVVDVIENTEAIVEEIIETEVSEIEKSEIVENIIDLIAEPVEILSSDIPKSETESELKSQQQITPVVEKIDLTDPSQYNKLFKTNTDHFSQPNAPKVDPNFKALTDKVKYMEDWLTKISMAGPGSGEVNLKYLDDVNQKTIQDGRFLRYNGASDNFEFVTISGSGAPQVQSDWTQVDNTQVDFIKNKPTIPSAQVNSDWNSANGVSQILNKPTLFSGSYNDLTNKPIIPAAQVNSDWNSANGVSQILNKPTLFSGSYNDLTNKPTIPAAQIQSDWNQSSNLSLDYIKNKPSLANVATSGSYTDLINKPTIPTNLDSLTDVTITNPTISQVLKYNGSQWVNDTDATSSGGSTTPGYYGSFYDLQTQYAAAVNTPYPVYLRTMDGHNGVSVTSNSRITCTYAGVYNIQFSLQMYNQGGGGNGTSVWIWIRQNGVDVVDTATNVEVPTNSPYIVPAWNFILSANAGDYFELMWATNNTNIVIQYETQKSFCPAIPSAIVTAQEVAAVLIPTDITGNANTVTHGVYTTDTGTVTNTMLAGSISNAKLANSSVTINGSTVSLGSTSTITAAANTLTGLSLNSSIISSNLSSVGTLSNLSINSANTGTVLSISGAPFQPVGQQTWTFKTSVSLGQPLSWINFPDNTNQYTAYTGNANTVTNGVYTTDTGTVTNTMLAGSITNNKLANSSVTINGSTVSLGANTSISSIVNGNYATQVTSSGQLQVPVITQGSFTGGVLVAAGNVLLNANGNLWNFGSDGTMTSPYSVKILTTGFQIPGSTSGTVSLAVPAVAGTTTITLPATTGTVITTGDSSTVTNTMLAGSITNNKLANSSVTINGSTVSLGSTSTITAAANTLTSNTLNSTVINSSLTSVGTLTSLNSSGAVRFTANTSGSSYNDINNAVNITGALGVSSNMFVNGNIEIANGSAIYMTGLAGALLSQTTLNSSVINSSLTSVGTLTNLTVTNTINGSISGAAPAGSLSGTTLKSTVVNSSLTSVGTLSNLTVAGGASPTGGVESTHYLNVGSYGHMFDDGNFHIHAKVGDLWLNSLESGRYIQLNTQGYGAGVKLGGDVISTTPFQGKTPFNSALDTVVTVDNLKFRISNQGGIFPQVESNTSGTVDICWSILGVVSGAGTTSNENSGTLVANNAWTTLYSTHGMDTRGDNLVAHITDKNAGKIYRVTFMVTNNSGNTTGYNIVVERII